MKKTFFLLLICIASILQVSFLDRFSFFRVKPDIMLLGVIIAGLCFELKWALFFAFIAGLLKDTFSANAYISYAMLFSFFAFLIFEARRKISIDNNLMRVLFIFVVSFLCSIVIGILFSLWARSIPIGLFLRISFLEALLTAAVFCLTLKFLKPEFYL